MEKIFMLCATAPQHVSQEIYRIRKSLFSRYGIVSAMAFDEIIPIGFYPVPIEQQLFTGIGSSEEISFSGRLHITPEAVYAAVSPAQVFTLLREKAGKFKTKGLFEPENGFFLSKHPEGNGLYRLKETVKRLETTRFRWKTMGLKLISMEYENPGQWEEALIWNTLWETRLQGL